MPSKKTFCSWLLCQRKNNLFAQWVFGELIEWEGSKVKLRLLSNEHDRLDQYYDTCKQYDMYLRDLECKKDKKKVLITRRT
jgi:hypothetical protein